MDIIQIASRVERRLNEQVIEFNILRDRILSILGFGIALPSVVFSYLEKINPPFKYLVIGLTLVSLVSIGVLTYALFSKPISRGMNVELMKNIIENPQDKNDFFKNDISYNLESFKKNAPLLEKIKYKLNCG